MLDFVKVSAKRNKSTGEMEVSPSFKVIRSKDVMIRGNSFYAIWDEHQQQWSTDEFDAIRLIDQMVVDYCKDKCDDSAIPQLLVNADNCLIDKWKKYCQKQAIDNHVPLDESLIFSNMELKRSNYSSRRLDYPLEPGDHSSWDRLVSVLYNDEERHKIEWAIGSIVSGDSKKIQKFMVFYGSAGTGKSTVLNIVQMLFDGYYSIFDAKALGSNNNVFALEAFRSNPLVAIQHDGDLSRIEDNTKLNSLVSHEQMTINEKFKASYTSSFKAFLMMGTNKPVKITDAKSGLIRRLIDVTPTGKKVDSSEYTDLMNKIPFQLSGIAHHCLSVYNDNPKYYNSYVPMEMLGESNDFYNFIADNFQVLAEAVDVSLNHGWELYKHYVEDAAVPYPLSKRAFKSEFRNYFEDFKDRYTTADGKRARSYYVGFLTEKFNGAKEPEFVPAKGVTLEDLGLAYGVESKFDLMALDYKAQYTTKDGIPLSKWDDVKTTLRDINTNELHYVKVPTNHIVIDFDIPGKDGSKDLNKNLEAAKKWPKTYTELSKSGSGVHLHYIYTGDATKLSRVFDDHIEIKVYTGNSSLRRKLTMCNDCEVNTISSGLPIKEEKTIVSKDVIKNEKMLRHIILKNLNKEYHDSTTSSIHLIQKVLADAYSSGVNYDVTDLRPSVTAFAANSSNQADTCLKIVTTMRFKSEDSSEPVDSKYDSIVFFDIEVFPNLFLVNWKYEGADSKVVRMINPSPADIERLCQFKLIGFNNRRYDNHILYARMMGYSIEDLYILSQRIINNSPNALFGEAYNLSYTDVYDFASAGNKQSLKKWEIELGIKHHELGLPWDQPVPENLWIKVAEYCDDDVIATEAVFNHLKADYDTRIILAEIAGKSVNSSTNSLTTKIVFDGNKNPQSSFHYRDLSKPVNFGTLDNEVENYIWTNTCLPLEFIAYNGTRSVLPYFPGYKFENGKSTYRGFEVGEGGFVYAEPGIHENVALLDVASMHPHSMITECLFGPKYTARFQDLVKGRIAIKHKDYDTARSILDGKFAPYVTDDENMLKILSTALKTPINSAYGLTSAGFSNEFRDPRNVDNIVAKRGALFMIDLKYEVEKRGFTVAHIKTDSIKIPNATPEILKFVMDFGKKYGYEFEHEATYAKMCLVNNAVYIAKYADANICKNMYGYIPGDNIKKGNKWSATGTQFAVPYVFKTLFSHEAITIDDMCEVKSVKTAICLDYNEDLPNVVSYEKEAENLLKQYTKCLIDDVEYNNLRNELYSNIDKGHKYVFVGKVGGFTPVKPGCGGALLVKHGVAKDNKIKYDAVTGTKGYRWMPTDEITDPSIIDRTFYKSLVDDALSAIRKYGDAELFIE